MYFDLVLRKGVSCSAFPARFHPAFKPVRDPPPLLFRSQEFTAPRVVLVRVSVAGGVRLALIAAVLRAGRRVVELFHVAEAVLPRRRAVLLVEVQARLQLTARRRSVRRSLNRELDGAAGRASAKESGVWGHREADRELVRGGTQPDDLHSGRRQGGGVRQRLREVAAKVLGHVDGGRRWRLRWWQDPGLQNLGVENGV